MVTSLDALGSAKSQTGGMKKGSSVLSLRSLTSLGVATLRRTIGILVRQRAAAGAAPPVSPSQRAVEQKTS
jgi:hypothetical protein